MRVMEPGKSYTTLQLVRMLNNPSITTGNLGGALGTLWVDGRIRRLHGGTKLRYKWKLPEERIHSIVEVGESPIRFRVVDHDAPLFASLKWAVLWLEEEDPECH